MSETGHIQIAVRLFSSLLFIVSTTPKALMNCVLYTVVLFFYYET